MSAITSPHKRIATAFLQMVVNGDVHDAYRTYTSPEMRLHNVYTADAASLEQAVAEDRLTHPHKRITIHMLVEEDDRVMALSHLRMTEGDAGYAMVHIFRFHEDRIVELWPALFIIKSNNASASPAFLMYHE